MMGESTSPSASPPTRRLSEGPRLHRRLGVVLCVVLLIALGTCIVLHTRQQSGAQPLLPPTLGTAEVAGGPVDGTVTVNHVQLLCDVVHGRLTLRWQMPGQLTLALTGVAGVERVGTTGTGQSTELLSSEYRQHHVSTQVTGDGIVVTFSHIDPRYPTLREHIQIRRSDSTVTLRLEVGTTGGPKVSVDRMDPLISVGQPALGNVEPDGIVFAMNASTATHQPRLFLPLNALPLTTSMPYVTTLTTTRGILLAGALDSRAFLSFVAITRGHKGVDQLAAAEIGTVSGRVIDAEPFLLGLFHSQSSALQAYARRIGANEPSLPDRQFVQMGWSSWGAFKAAISESLIRRNTDFVAAHLRTAGYTTIHIDDGWEQRYGDWQPGSGFAGGMGALAAYIHSKQLKASIWYAPFLAAANSWPARTHPEWLLHNQDGTLATLMLTSKTDILDASNPGALAYIRGVCQRIRGWGFDSVKLDFLYLGAGDGRRFGSSIDGLQAYNAAMTMIRDTLEANVTHPLYLIGVQQDFLPAGFFQGWRVGPDIENQANPGSIPSWKEVRTEALAVNAFAFASGPVYGNDPDDLVLRSVPGAVLLTSIELQTYLTMVALGGRIWLSGDDLPTLAAQHRLNYLTNGEVLAVVRAGQVGLPLQITDQLNGPAPIWRADGGHGTVVAAVFNWSDSPQRIPLAFADLHLPRGNAFRVRDLWAHRDLTPSNGSISFSLKPHQSYLLRISAEQT